jgi:hypothetical protein
MLFETKHVKMSNQGKDEDFSVIVCNVDVDDDDDDDDDDEAFSFPGMIMRPTMMDTVQEEESTGGEESSSNHSGRASHLNNTNNNARDVVQNIVGRESQQIFWLRWMAIAVLVGSTCLTSLAIFRVSRNAEVDVFETQFKGQAIILKDAIRSKVVHMTRSMDNFAMMMTSHSVQQQQEQQQEQQQAINSVGTFVWPYQVVPQFEIRGASTKALLGEVAELLMFLPLITSETRDKWELFSTNNVQWIQQGIEQEELVASGRAEDTHNHAHRRHVEEAHGGTATMTANQTTSNDATPTPSTMTSTLADFSNSAGIISSTIFTFEEDSVGGHQAIVEPSGGNNTDSSIYFPVWQMTPVHEELVNYNVYGHSSFGQDLRAAVISKSITFGQVADVSDIHDPFSFLHVKVPAEGDHHHEDEEDEAGHHDHDSHDHDSHDHDSHDTHEDETMADITNTNVTAEEEEDHDDHGRRRLKLHRRRKLQNETVQEDEEEHTDHGEEEEHHDEEQHEEDHQDDVHVEHHEEDHQDDAHVVDDTSNFGDPLSMTFFPVFDHFESDRELVGFLGAAIYWGRLFATALPSDGSGPIHVILENDCGQVFTYVLHPQGEQVVGGGGAKKTILSGDHHDDNYAYLELELPLNSIDVHYGHDGEESSHHNDASEAEASEDILTYSGVGLDFDYCPYTVRIYPTAEMEKSFYTWQPFMYAMMVVLVLVFASIIFWVYDSIVERRQRKVTQTAVESTAVIHSLFPSNVRDRLLQQQKQDALALGDKSALNPSAAFLNDGGRTLLGKAPPIADLFPFATVLFADISGFTAWSSSREPAQASVLHICATSNSFI